MKNKYTPLVSVKKNIYERSERVLQDANLTLKNAYAALEESLVELQNIQQPLSGNMSQFLASRELFEAQRTLIIHNQEWVSFAKKSLKEAQEQLKHDMIEYEKFKYLELQLLEENLKEEKLKDAKNLDEIALMTYKKNKKRVA